MFLKSTFPALALGLRFVIAVMLIAAAAAATWLSVDAVTALGVAILLTLLCAWRLAVHALAPLRALEQVAESHLGGRFELRAPERLPRPAESIGRALDEHARHRRESREVHQEAIERATRALREDLATLRGHMRRLQADAAAARDAEQGKSALLTSMGHELRTPLTAIIGFADLLRRTPLDAEQSEYVGTLHESAQGLLLMINDLLDWGRMEAGRLSLQAIDFDLADCVEDTVALLAPMAYEKQLELCCIVYHDVPARLRGDPSRLRQIMTNLVSNAIKYTAQGEVVLRVMKERDLDDGMRLCIRVSDTGRGMTPAQQQRLFEAFTPAARAGDDVSTGLGLSIVRRLAEMMDGDVKVESEEGRGSSFSVSLQLALPQAAISAAVPDALQGCTAWVLEPHPTARLTLSHCLEYWGLALRHFDSADTLTAALRHAAQPPPLVIAGLAERDLSDRAIGELCAAASASSSAMLALVASMDPSVHERLLAMGASAVLAKSSGRATLYRTLVGLTDGDLGEAPLRDQKLLIVENTESSRRLIKRMADSLGAQTLEAEDGEAALRQWSQHRPRFVLMDMHMPVLDGRGAARAMRSVEGSARKTAIIAISAYMEPEEQAAALDDGFDDVLLKPFDERQLLRTLSPWLRSPRRRAEPAPATGIGRQLVSDPELLALLLAELPDQLAAIEHSYASGDGAGLREAAHALHGTAAFYNLAALKDAAAQLEQRLAQASVHGINDPRLRDDVARTRSAHGDTLRALRRSSVKRG